MVMAHGIGSTKEMCLPQFAERFAAAGFAVLLFDYRNLGESEGIGSAARIETTCFPYFLWSEQSQKRPDQGA